VNNYPASRPDREPAAPASGYVTVRLPSTLPIVTYVILGLTVLVFLIQLVTSNYYYSLDLPTLLGGKINEAIRAGEYWRLITPVLVHVSILHIGFNMYALFSFGMGLERRYGRLRFLALYLLAGFAGNVLSFLFSSGISVGASTSIFGLIGAEGVFLYQNRKLFGNEAKQAMGNVIAVAAFNLFLGFSSGGRIDNWGHIGGLLGGLMFAWFAGPLWDLEGIYPLVRLVDRRTVRDVALAAAGVLIVFGGLAMLGIKSVIVP